LVQLEVLLNRLIMLFIHNIFSIYSNQELWRPTQDSFKRSALKHEARCSRNLDLLDAPSFALIDSSMVTLFILERMNCMNQIVHMEGRCRQISQALIILCALNVSFTLRTAHRHAGKQRQ
jgi:hypothetical protein